MALFEGHFPYTNFHDLNLDWLLQKVKDHETRITSLEGRMDQAEQDIDALEERMQTAEDDIDALEGRMDTAEDDINALEGRMDTAEDDIDALEGRMDTAEDDIDALEGRMDTAEDDIDALEGLMDTAGDDIDALEKVIEKLTVTGVVYDNNNEPPTEVPFFSSFASCISLYPQHHHSRCGNVISFDQRIKYEPVEQGPMDAATGDTSAILTWPLQHFQVQRREQLLNCGVQVTLHMNDQNLGTNWKTSVITDSLAPVFIGIIGADQDTHTLYFNFGAVKELFWDNTDVISSQPDTYYYEIRIHGTYVTTDESYYTDRYSVERITPV